MGIFQSKPYDADLRNVMGNLENVLKCLDRHITSENGDSSTVVYRTTDINSVKTNIKGVIEMIESVIQRGEVKESDPHTVGIWDPVSSNATENFITLLPSWLQKNVQLNCLNNTSKIDAHTFVICNNASRLETDIAATLKTVKSKDWNKIMVIVLHAKSIDQLPTRQIEKVLQGNKDYKEIKHVVDMAYTKADNIYACDMNSLARSKIEKFLSEPMKSINEESSKVNTKEDDNEKDGNLPADQNDEYSKVNTKEDDNEKGENFPSDHIEETSQVNTKEDDNEKGGKLPANQNDESSKVNSKEDDKKKGENLQADHNDESSKVKTKEDDNKNGGEVSADHNDESSKVISKEVENRKGDKIQLDHNDESSKVNTKEDDNEKGGKLSADQNDVSGYLESSKVSSKEDDIEKGENLHADHNEESSKVNTKEDDNEKGRNLQADHNDETSKDHSKEDDDEVGQKLY